MVKTASSMLPLGTRAPEFELLNPVSQEIHSLQNSKGDVVTVIMFICNHCPYVKHVTHELARLGKDYHSSEISIIAINSNDVETYPEDSPEQMVVEVETHGYNFPYLYDETQEVARAYQAECTPDFYVFDANLQCVYRGQLCESRPGNGIEVTGKDLRAAIENTVAGRPVHSEQTPSIGCNIKWRVE